MYIVPLSPSSTDPHSLAPPSPYLGRLAMSLGRHLLWCWEANPQTEGQHRRLLQLWLQASPTPSAARCKSKGAGRGWGREASSPT